MIPVFEDITVAAEPFLNVQIGSILGAHEASLVLEWLESSAPWTLRRTSFYEQYEVGLLSAALPDDIAFLRSASFIDALVVFLRRSMPVRAPVEIVTVCAHKLIPGQRIGVHSDYCDDRETHRIIIQLNSGWREDQGGLLNLYRTDNQKIPVATILPVHRSAVAFPISRSSFHSVSPVLEGWRYTIVYTFKD